MTPKDAFETILRLVPLWYVASCGPERNSLNIGSESFPFHSLHESTRTLSRYKDTAQAIASQLLSQSPHFPVPSFADMLSETLVLEWLRMQSRDIAWEEVLSYTAALADRTYENAPVTVNVIVRPGAKGAHPLYDDKYSKFTDHLASSLFTYFLTDDHLNVVDYREIEWDQIGTHHVGKCYPEILHPFQCVMTQGDFSFHLTRQRDLLITCKGSLIAARRKRQWKLYESGTLRAAVAAALSHNSIGAAVYGILFDLSFRRHGALLVFDPDDTAIEETINPECRLGTGVPTEGRELIADAASRICLQQSMYGFVANKRLLLELAGIDGAVVFNKEKITAVGAIIRTHENAKGIAGARSTAALSAYLYGGRPVKVSSDGEVTIIFDSSDGSRECRAQLEWL